MENCTDGRRCLICRRVALEDSSCSEKFVSSAPLLQDFLNCFHNNALDSEVNDLSTSCQLCPTCEQFLTEWSSIRTQMTQLTRRAAQLKATLSALLLSAPQTQEQNPNEDATDIINSKMGNSQEVELPLPLQRAVDAIRNELRRKYSVRVVMDKIPLPSVRKLEPWPVDYENNDQVWDVWECGPNTQVSVVPKIEANQEQLNVDETSEQIETEEEANWDDSKSKDCVDSKETKDKNVNIKTNGGLKRKRTARNVDIIPDCSIGFQYNGCILTQHVNLEGDADDEGIPSAVTDMPSVSDPVQGDFQSVVYTFNPGRVLTPFDTSSLTGFKNVPKRSANAVKKGQRSRWDRSKSVRVCLLCPEHAAFEHRNARKVREHIAKVHKAGKIYDCPHCGVNLCRAEILKRHVKKIHGK